MSPAGFEPVIPAYERPSQTHALKRAVTGIGEKQNGTKFYVERRKGRNYFQDSEVDSRVTLQCSTKRR
jgi:hypothetical protein